MWPWNRRAKYSVRRLARIDLSDDDVLVVHCDSPLDEDSARRVEDSLRRLFGYHRKVLVLDKGVVITVVGPQKDADADSDE